MNVSNIMRKHKNNVTSYFNFILKRQNQKINKALYIMKDFVD